MRHTTAAQRAAWQAAVDAATPGECRILPYYKSIRGAVQIKPPGGKEWAQIGEFSLIDAALYTAAREAIPALLAEVAHLRAALKPLTFAIYSTTYSPSTVKNACVHCNASAIVDDHADMVDDLEHTDDCPVTLARKLLEDTE